MTIVSLNIKPFLYIGIILFFIFDYSIMRMYCAHVQTLCDLISMIIITDNALNHQFSEKSTVLTKVLRLFLTVTLKQSRLLFHVDRLLTSYSGQEH